MPQLQYVQLDHNVILSCEVSLMTIPTPQETDGLRFNRVALATGVTLHYADNGEKGRTPVVFLHGFADSWRSFAGVIVALAPGHRTVAFDLRGHGDSNRPESGYTIADFTQDLLLSVNALGLDKVNLVGHSFGSFIAQSFAAHYPRRVERLVLIGSAPQAASNTAIREMEVLIDALRDPVERDFVRDFQATAAPVPTDFMETIILESLKVPARVWRSAFSGLLAADNRPVLHAVTAPTLILWGNRDTIFKRADQEELLSHITGSILKEFDAGHALHWEKPGEVASVLEAFLEENL